jgi:CHAP domain
MKGMSFDVAMARMAELQSMFNPPAAAPVAGATAAASTSSTAFATQLQNAAAPANATLMGVASPLGATTTAGPAASPAGQAVLNAVRGEVGVAEQPPGSNDSPRIAQYRQATAGSGVGPWCAYFASWAARQAGVPLGDSGQGFGGVSDVYAWAQKSGKAIPNGPGVKPAPGDLIVWGGEHIGVVESVDPDGSIHTIEGNSSDQVSRRTYAPGERPATGYVHLG